MSSDCSTRLFAQAQLATHGWTLGLRLYWARRAAKNVIELYQALAVVLTLIPRGQVWFTRCGEHALYAYLFHELVLHWREALVRRLPLPVLTSSAGHALVLALNFGLCAGLCAALCSAPFRALASPLVHPRWLERLASSADHEEPRARPSHEHEERHVDEDDDGACEALPMMTCGALKPESADESADVGPGGDAPGGREDVGAASFSFGGPRLAALLDVLTTTRPSRGRLTLPWQRSGHPYMRFLILLPLVQLALFGLTAVVVLPFARRVVVESGTLEVVLLDSPAILGLIFVGLVTALAVDVGRDVLTCACLYRGIQRAPLEPASERRTPLVLLYLMVFL